MRRTTHTPKNNQVVEKYQGKASRLEESKGVGVAGRGKSLLPCSELGHARYKVMDFQVSPGNGPRVFQKKTSV